MNKLIWNIVFVSAILMFGLTCKGIKYRAVRYSNCEALTNSSWKLSHPVYQKVKDSIIIHFRENYIDIVVDNDTVTGLYFYKSCEGIMNVLILYTKLDLHVRNLPDRRRTINKLLKFKSYYKLNNYENISNKNETYRDIFRLLYDDLRVEVGKDSVVLTNTFLNRKMILVK